MSHELLLLLSTAATIGFIHTILGPDHYLPFLVMARAREWSFLKTMTITLLCGMGHVLGSVILGVAGVMLGVVVSKLEIFESFRGEMAAWALIAVGTIYFVWGVRKAIRNRPHTHTHSHNGLNHSHTHSHVADHSHVHLKSGNDITPWILFTLFFFGPCEPLIPILMYPAAKQSMAGMLLVTSVFAAVTIATMLSVVSLSFWGFKKIPMPGLECYSHALAGLTLFLCGGAIQFLGLWAFKKSVLEWSAGQPERNYSFKIKGYRL